MSDELCNEASQPAAENGNLGESSGKTVLCSKPSPESQVEPAAAGEAATPKKLTKEEQMALYEKELKENDWGHQPC